MTEKEQRETEANTREIKRVLDNGYEKLDNVGIMNFHSRCNFR